MRFIRKYKKTTVFLLILCVLAFKAQRAAERHRQGICPETGKIRTDREQILSALEYVNTRNISDAIKDYNEVKSHVPIKRIKKLSPQEILENYPNCCSIERGEYFYAGQDQDNFKPSWWDYLEGTPSDSVFVNYPIYYIQGGIEKMMMVKDRDDLSIWPIAHVTPCGYAYGY